MSALYVLQHVTPAETAIFGASRWATAGCGCTASTPRRASSSASTAAAASSPAVRFDCRHTLTLSQRPHECDAVIMGLLASGHDQASRRL